MAGVPSLIVKKPGRGIRALSLVSAGVREVSAQIEPYTKWWDDQNQLAVTTDGPLWIVLGDSTSIGIGASEPANGYVGLVIDKLRAIDPAWRVINLAMSGARVADGLNRQIPALAELPTPTVLTVCLGSNDVFWEWSKSLSGDLTKLVERLPADKMRTSRWRPRPATLRGRDWQTERSRQRRLGTTMTFSTLGTNVRQAHFLGWRQIGSTPVIPVTATWRSPSGEQSGCSIDLHVGNSQRTPRPERASAPQA